jgi:cytosine/uracil/thiamine/allantoin permease
LDRSTAPRLPTTREVEVQVPTLVITGAHPQLYNHDLAPTAPEGRTWGAFSLFAMWMSDVHSVGGYTFAASLFFLGLTDWQVLISMLVGITTVYFLMNLIGRPSVRYGIPFPVMARVSFGVMGATSRPSCAASSASFGTACRPISPRRRCRSLS